MIMIYMYVVTLSSLYFDSFCSSENKQSIGELFVGFFKYYALDFRYGFFPYYLHMISLALGGQSINCKLYVTMPSFALLCYIKIIVT